MLNKLRNIKELVKAILIYRFFPPYLRDNFNKVDRVDYPLAIVSIRSRIFNIVLFTILYCIGLYTLVYRNDISIYNTNLIELSILFVSVVFFLSATSIYITLKIIKKALKQAKTNTLDDTRDDKN